MSARRAVLSSSDLGTALGFAADLAASRGTVELNQQVKRLPGLIGSDTVLIGEVHLPAAGDGATATLSADGDPPGTFDEETRSAFVRLWHQHPVVTRHFGGPTRGAMKISDFLSDRKWRRTELFGECYGGRLGMGWEIGTQIHFGARQQACVALGRTGSDFAERDRAFLDAVNPHLRAGYARLEREAERGERIALLERGLESRGEAVIVVDRRGRIARSGSDTRELLRTWFGDAAGQRALPPEVETWRRDHRGSPDPSPLEERRGDRRLRLRLVAGSIEDAILVSERSDAPPDPAVLARRLSISRREAEVLALLAEGLMNAAIAVELDLSPSTVGRYIERVYAKLDVHNRAAATGAVRDALEI
jgi:DNA-binding CsgD family transcriptional regulator